MQAATVRDETPERGESGTHWRCGRSTLLHPLDRPMAFVPSKFGSALHRVEIAFAAVRLSAAEVLRPLLPASSGARSCGRALGLERTLGWKLWTIAHTADLATGLRAMPGRRGWSQVMNALRQRNASAVALESLHGAVEQFLATLGEFQADPALLRAIGAGGMDRREERQKMVAARRRSSRANEQVYGLHAELVIVSALLCPGPAAGTVSLACTTLFDGVRRTRPGMPWPIYGRLATLDTLRNERKLGTPMDLMSPLPPVVSDLSSPGLTDTRLRIGERDGGAFVELADLGPDDPPARICTSEFIAVASDPGPLPHPVHLRFGSQLPTDLLTLEVMVHRSLPLATTPSPWLCATPLSIRSLHGWHEEVRLPLEVEPRPIDLSVKPRGRAPAGVRLELLRRTTSALHHALDEFAAFEASVAFPPLFGSLFMSCELGADPDASSNPARSR